jgi:hypothetical protein
VRKVRKEGTSISNSITLLMMALTDSLMDVLIWARREKVSFQIIVVAVSPLIWKRPEGTRG